MYQNHKGVNDVYKQENSQILHQNICMQRVRDYL